MSGGRGAAIDAGALYFPGDTTSVQLGDDWEQLSCERAFVLSGGRGIPLRVAAEATEHDPWAATNKFFAAVENDRDARAQREALSVRR